MQFMPAYSNNELIKSVEKSDTEKNGVNVMLESLWTNPSSEPLAVPNSTIPISLPLSDINESNQPAAKSDYNSSSQKSFHSNENESITSVDDDDKIKELLNSFDECDREAILKIPASSNFEDLNLMVRLLNAGYFKGEHHLEEIMYFENLRRSQLLQLLDKFRDVLIIYETEDPATCSLSF